MNTTKNEQNFSFPCTQHKLIYVKLHINKLITHISHLFLRYDFLVLSIFAHLS